MDTEEAAVEVQTSVDMLIARMETHPHEFFNAELLPKLDASEVLKGCKWGRLASHICNPTAKGLFSLDEKERFAVALDRTMREALDVLIVKALVAGEPFENKPAAKGQGLTAQTASGLMNTSNQGLYGSALGSVQSAYEKAKQEALYNQGMSSQSIGNQMLNAEMAYERQKWEQERAMRMAGLATPEMEMDHDRLAWIKKPFKNFL